MGPRGRRRSGAPLAFMLTLAVVLVCSVLTVAGDIVAGDDTLRFVAGDRPVYHLATGTSGTDEWLDWHLPTGGRGIKITYEGVDGDVRRPATLHIRGFLLYRDGNGACPARAEWDVSVAGDSSASGVLSPDGNEVDVKPKLPDLYAGLPIGISVRRVDRENCAAILRIHELWISGDMPIPFLPYSSPQIFIIDECRNEEPCPKV